MSFELDCPYPDRVFFLLAFKMASLNRQSSGSGTGTHNNFFISATCIHEQILSESVLPIDHAVWLIGLLLFLFSVLCTRQSTKYKAKANAISATITTSRCSQPRGHLPRRVLQPVPRVGQVRLVDHVTHLRRGHASSGSKRACG